MFSKDEVNEKKKHKKKNKKYVVRSVKMLMVAIATSNSSIEHRATAAIGTPAHRSTAVNG